MKKIYKVLLFFSIFVVLSLIFATVLTLFPSENQQTKLKHFYNDNVEMINDLTFDEQEQILELFNIDIPKNETKAYVYSFQKCSYGNDLYAYVVEFDGVSSYRNFYEANAERIGKNGLPDVSCNQFESVSLEQLRNNELSGIGDGKTDYYLTYQIIAHKTEEQRISDLYEEFSSRRK